jgi:hypothetical protein
VNWKSQQNPDGGWAYSRGCSWTEPTALVLLAQSATGIDRDSFGAGANFLRSLAGPDGGWRPQSGVSESTWVTSLVALLPPEATGVRQHLRAIEWLKGQTGKESNGPGGLPRGWPWFPGASAWVVPTSLAILAFERELEVRPDSEISNRISDGKRFLLSRMCADGGWNYGGNRALGRDGDSYPETTGIALLALRGVSIGRSLATANRHLTDCRGAEGIAWLRMGLAAHGEIAPVPREPVIRTNTDAALWALASAARNPLIT